jgi:hypothetical protein
MPDAPVFVEGDDGGSPDSLGTPKGFATTYDSKTEHYYRHLD